MLRFEVPMKVIITLPDAEVGKWEPGKQMQPEQSKAVVAAEQKFNDIGMFEDAEAGRVSVRVHMGEDYM